jgi:hypothetical protein
MSVNCSRPSHDGRAQHLAREVEFRLSSGGTLVLLDLEPVLGVGIAAELSERRHAHVVLVLPRWPYTSAVLPTSELTHALIDESKRLTTDVQSGNVVFVLDGERTKRIGRKTAAQADNRYRLSPADLPNLNVLRAHGIRRIVKVVA